MIKIKTSVKSSLFFIFDPVNIARFIFHVIMFVFLKAWSSDAFDISLCCGHVHGR